jgi:hypothetical protein
LETIGKIFTKSEAVTLYDAVNSSSKINTSELQNIVTKTKDHIMFQIIEGELIILDNKRNIIFTDGNSNTVSKSTVFHVFSTSVVNKLLADNNNPETHVEKRKNVLTITNGDTTLEQGIDCPPFCP